ncbi:MAG: hypothetical protein N0E59_18485 [Candidatus Thiodiazotropha taylori]|nr:hypothetical protein [Candidatus Thiodiazotropha taylori]MCW4270157.1 hypothetical protein [Candidatus Thiodiazotropha endolucinida]MCG8034841.1 hypothetical protein [Candidatus Thiodiazotropha taylori]MCG8048712.1 hypothetical protein [Candidatus Thiodiazotropha taylori]MCG8112749.1 hypothetical protein [Candidatus Thiodiazotropha taylori]
MTDKSANLYIPDYQAWENFYEKTAKRSNRVGFGLETESEAVKEQQQKSLVIDPQRVKHCEQNHNAEPKIINVISPTEQTVQQAANVMKKAGIKTKRKCTGKKKSKDSRRKKAKNQKRNSKKRASGFNYRTLGDIFSKRK